MSTNWKTLRIFWQYWWRFPRLFLGSLLYGPVFALQNIIGPLFVAQALGQLSKHQLVSPRLIVYAAAALLIALIVGYFVNLYDAKLEHKVDDAMYNDCFQYLVYQDYDFFANNFGGALVTRANRFVKSYSTFHLAFFLDVLPQVSAVLIALSIIIYYSPILGLAISALWLVSVLIIITLTIRRMPLRRAAVAKDSIQTGELADTITNALTVKTFASEEREMRRYRHTNTVRGTYFFRSWRRAIRNGWVVELLCVTLQIAIFLGGIVEVENHAISLAVFLLFQVYILRIVDSLRHSALIARQIEGVLGDAQEMTQLMQTVPLVRDPTNPQETHIQAGAIRFKTMSFGYADAKSSRESLFTDFDLTLRPGEKVGLVGPSGGGKTTITKLLLRFMDVTAGTIEIDGQDIRAIRQHDLRNSIAYVPQEPLLFHRTVKENITYGKPDASDTEIIAAAKKAYAHDFIEQLPHGYDTLVGERGVKLSGGQRQRIAIARAMLKNAPILVLDEATSALDSESERVIQAALWDLMKDKTALVIAHRLSTIQKLDRIVVLDEGHVIEDGPHQSLLARKGLYAKLWAHQSGGFIDE